MILPEKTPPPTPNLYVNLLLSLSHIKLAEHYYEKVKPAFTETVRNLSVHDEQTVLECIDVLKMLTSKLSDAVRPIEVDDTKDISHDNFAGLLETYGYTEVDEKDFVEYESDDTEDIDTIS